MAGPSKKEAKKGRTSKASYFFGALKKIALLPFAAAQSAKSSKAWEEQSDPFHQRSDITFT
jgi:hypothetical protein